MALARIDWYLTSVDIDVHDSGCALLVLGTKLMSSDMGSYCTHEVWRKFFSVQYTIHNCMSSALYKIQPAILWYYLAPEVCQILVVYYWS